MTNYVIDISNYNVESQSQIIINSNIELTEKNFNGSGLSQDIRQAIMVGRMTLKNNYIWIINNYIQLGSDISQQNFD